MPEQAPAPDSAVARFSVSLPGSLLARLDDMVEERQLPSRSHLIAEMVRHELADHTFKIGERLVAGTVTMIYGNNRNALRAQLADVQSRYVKEVISSQHVFLEDDQSMEVLLVQGPGQRLESLCDELRSCRGVQQVRLVTTAALLPPLHDREHDG